MIHYYKGENFYSINAQTEVSFEVNQKAPRSNTYTTGKNRVSLIEAIIGPNASGKTNILKLLGFIRYIVIESGSSDKILLRTFCDKKKPAKFEIKFTVNKEIYVYIVEMNSDRILREILKVLNSSGKRMTYKTVYQRKWDKGNKQYSWQDTYFGLSTKFTPKATASIFTSVWNIDETNERAKSILDFWRNSVQLNVWEGGNQDDHNGIHGDNVTHRAISYLHKRVALMDAVKTILKNIDVGFDDFEKEILEIENRELFGIKHVYENNTEFSIPLRYESSGTKRLIAILRFVVQVLNNKSGGVVAIDELDAYLHPDIVELVVGLFTSPATNPYKAQLLFSSHSHRLLASLDKQQIILVEKDSYGSTGSWRLDEVEGVRSDDNYYTKYIAGVYGARPKIGSSSM